MNKVEEVIETTPSKTDPLGSYTGDSDQPGRKTRTGRGRSIKRKGFPFLFIFPKI